MGASQLLPLRPSSRARLPPSETRQKGLVPTCTAPPLPPLPPLLLQNTLPCASCSLSSPPGVSRSCPGSFTAAWTTTDQSTLAACLSTKAS
jgi:hypothetical protein